MKWLKNCLSRFFCNVCCSKKVLDEVDDVIDAINEEIKEEIENINQ